MIFDDTIVPTKDYNEQKYCSVRNSQNSTPGGGTYDRTIWTISPQKCLMTKVKDAKLSARKMACILKN